MRNKVVKYMSIGLCIILCTGSIGATTYAKGNKFNKDTTVKTENVSNSSEDDDKVLSKDETVYVLAGADGTVNKIIVSDWIKNCLAEGSINDKSELTDIENVKGDESYTMNGDNMCVWDAQGKDIYYQGNIQKELPVNIKVTYTLDGNNISAEDLAGKSGHLVIRYDYENNQYETVSIDGKNEKIYVPFAMITGMLLDNDVFRNVEVSNGRLVNDGDRTIVAGIALPGLQENLGIDKETLEIPSYVEISADVENFEMSNTVTIATNDVFNKFDASEINNTDDLKSSLGDLTDGMNALLDGSSALYGGLETLLDKSGELVEGINKLAAGAAQLKDGSAALDKGAGDLVSGASALNNGAGDLVNGVGDLKTGADALNKGAGDLQTGADALDKGAADLNDGVDALSSGTSQLKDGTTQLASGLNELAANNDTLNAGSKQVFETLLSLADTQIADAGLTADKLTIENYNTVLEKLIASLNEDALTKQATAVAKKTVTDEVNKPDNYSKIKAGVTAAVRTQVEEGVTKVVRTQVEAAVTEAVRTQVEEGVTAAVRTQVEAGVTEAVRATVMEKVLESKGMTTETYDAAVKAGQIDEATQNAINQAIDAQMATDDIKATIKSNTDAKMATDDIKATIKSNTDAKMATEDIKSTIKSNTDAKMASDDIKATIKSNTDAKMATDDIKATITSKTKEQAQTIINEKMQSEEVQSLIKAGVEKGLAGAKTLKALEDQLDTYNQFYTGLGQYTAGVETAKDGANKLDAGAGDLVDGASQLKDGTTQLKDGTSSLVTGAGTLKDGTNQLVGGVDALGTGAGALKDGAGQLYDGTVTLKNGADSLNAGIVQLYDGILTLKDGAPALIDGIGKLKDGALQLSDGLNKFNDEGIKKISDLVEGDLETLVLRVKATADVSKNYKSFSGVSDDMDGSVKFIYRTDDIK